MTKDSLRYISEGAIIDESVEIGPFSYIDEDVVIGPNCWIGPNVTILSGTRIGSNCKIFPGAVLGAIPQDLKFEGEDSLLILGDRVTVREFCTLNRATKFSHQTIIEDDCLLMAYTHVAHDCIIGQGAILANNVNLAGHVQIGKNALLGGLVAVQQFVRIGDHSMIGGAGLVRKDVPPYIRAAHEPLAYIGVNKIGLERRGCSDIQIKRIQDLYRVIYGKGSTMVQKIRDIRANLPDSDEKKNLLEFIEKSESGIIGRPRG